MNKVIIISLNFVGDNQIIFNIQEENAKGEEEDSSLNQNKNYLQEILRKE